ncbi:MAG: hypothetical protein AAF739_11760 [Pseudomonadota bacterium]
MSRPVTARAEVPSWPSGRGLSTAEARAIDDMARRYPSVGRRMPVSNKQAELFLSIWNEPDADVRLGLIVSALDRDCIYDDVHRDGPCIGHSQFAMFITDFREEANNMVFSLDGDVESVRDFARIHFRVSRDGNPFGNGTYFVLQAEDGRLREIFGFMGR